MNENRLNFPEIQDAHLDQMIRLAFAQEAAHVGTGMDGAERNARDAAEQELGRAAFEADAGAD